MEVSRTSLLIRRIGAYVIDYCAIILIGLWLYRQEGLPFAGFELIFVYLFLYPLNRPGFRRHLHALN